MKIYLVRHTKVNCDPNICYGHTDVPLADSFNEEAARIKNILPDETLKCFSSDLKRCADLADHLSKNIEFDKDLREINFGDFEGLEWSDIEKFTKEIKPEEFIHFEYPNGESYKQQRNRVIRVLNYILKKQKDDFIIVSHGGSIRIIIAELLGVPLENSFRLKIDYGSVSEISIEGNFITVNKINML